MISLLWSSIDFYLSHPGFSGIRTLECNFTENAGQEMILCNSTTNMVAQRTAGVELERETRILCIKS